MIKKEGNKWSIYSETTNRKLGSYTSKNEAVTRLRQIEYFKNHPKAAKKEDPNAAVRNRGNVVFPAGSKKVKDNKDHFPINNADQARNALSRVAQYSSVPPWYSGSLSELQSAVRNAVSRKYKDINVTKGGEELIKNEPHAPVQNPNQGESKVPCVKTPSLKNLNEDEAQVYAAINQMSSVGRKILASNLMDHLNKHKERVNNAMELAKKLEKEGLSEEDFSKLHDYTQHDILQQLLDNAAKAAAKRKAVMALVIKGR